MFQANMNAIRAKPLNQETYRDYGDIISTRDDVVPAQANMGTAQRFNFLAALENHRLDGARANLCVFRCEPLIQAPDSSFQIRLLEKHSYSTQAFIPMKGAERFLVIVCLGGETPDLSTLRVFLASKSQGITYKPGVWHHPLVAMDCRTDFACLVWEDGTSDDCKIVKLSEPITTLV